ncbi:hypothetical protein ACVW0P_002471 [Mucilaginibacter sp. UYNi724]
METYNFPYTFFELIFNKSVVKEALKQNLN